MELNLVNWLLALCPVLAVLVLMVGAGWGGSRAGSAGFLVALALALTAFGGDAHLALVAIGKSVLLAIDVLYIVWMALFFYNVTNEAGAVSLIGRNLQRLTSDRAAQSLLISWIFVSLIQGVGGFGVPIAVVAPSACWLGLHGDAIGDYGFARARLGGYFRLVGNIIRRLDRRHRFARRGAGARCRL